MDESVNNEEGNICFYKGDKEYFSEENRGENKKINKIQQEFLKILNTHNLSFLLGAGCSSLKEEKEKGIPTMQGLAKEFCETIKGNSEIGTIFNQLNLNDNEKMKDNLEKLMEFLFAQRFIYEAFHDTNLVDIEKAIKYVQDFIFEKCNIEGREIIEIYKNFYRKLIYRDNNLAKINIFTTNYDLFNEKALDELGIIYANGFSGVVERFFNPAVFNYAFAEQMELSQNKWNVIDNFIYLYKLHGSINWVETENEQHLFKIQEIQSPNNSSKDTTERFMIYPTPIKQNASFGSPYSDIFREFQKKLMKSNNVLVVVGYSFADEHINNIIYQALTIPTFRLVILGDREKDNYKKLSELNDPRIWFIYGRENKVHYFKNFTEQILPDFQDEQIESQIEKIREIFYAQKGKND